MEEPLDFGFDHYYFYNGAYSCSPLPKTYIRIPVVKDKYKILPKEPGTLLLDHDSKLFTYYQQETHDWNEKIWSLLEHNRCGYHRIVQLERSPDIVRPSFIETIPIQSHDEYLAATACFETFLATHAGSYNHTAIDMALRGSRVINPATMSDIFVGTFVPKYQSDELDMVVVRTMEELEATLSDHRPGLPQLGKATDLDEVVAIMDRDFQAWASDSRL